jgi:Putative enzyme of poly-gamma-glutamate biosynthesis (capsule formation)
VSTIIVGADIAPTRSNFELFQEGNMKTLLGRDLYTFLRKADYTIFNLETPLTDRETPIIKYGPNLAAPTNVINGLKNINPYFFTLANNHILDQGIEGLYSTINILKENKIAYSGAGSNLKDAEQPYIVTLGNIRVGIYCCTENEFSIAAENDAGANPYDPLVSFDSVKQLKKECDYLIVLYHGGREQYRYPSPMLRRIFRKFADSGADIVIAQHTHCIGSREKYLDSTLVYGQGNFLFDYADNEYWNTSLLIKIEIEYGRKEADISYIPLCKKGNAVRLACKKEADRILQEFEDRSIEIKETGRVEKKYRDLSKKYEKKYYSHFFGRMGQSIIVRGINKISGNALLRFNYPSKLLPSIENCIECESHRELILTILREGRK